MSKYKILGEGIKDKVLVVETNINTSISS